MGTERVCSQGRRQFLALAAAAVTAPLSTSSRAQTTAGQSRRIIDFHNHFVGTAFTSAAGAAASQTQRARWAVINRNLASEDALISSIATAGVSARVINTPLEFLAGSDVHALDVVRRLNDQMAEVTSRHSQRLYGLATVDAYSGEAGARELTRAVRDLGLRGVFVESAKANLLLGALEARPTLATAARLGVPVFIHPITDPELSRRFASTPRLGTSLNRGTINAAGLFSLLENGVFDELPKLQVVVTTLALGGVLLAATSDDGFGLRKDTPANSRRHVYVDTMGLHPVLIRSAVDLLGADHVVVGTDWPIFTERDIEERLHRAFTLCGLDEAEQDMVASGNLARLLRIG